VKVKQHCFLDDKDLSLRLPTDVQSIHGIGWLVRDDSSGGDEPCG